MNVKVVQFTNANPILTLSCVSDATNEVENLFSADVMVVPPASSGSALAQTLQERLSSCDLDQLMGIVVLNHGLLTFGETGELAYRRHIELITRAEEYLQSTQVVAFSTPGPKPVEPVRLAQLRSAISRSAGRPLIMNRQARDGAADWLLQHPEVDHLTRLGPMTCADLRRIRFAPMVGLDVASYSEYHRGLIHDHASSAGVGERLIDAAPRIVIDPELDLLALGESTVDAEIARDVYRHTIESMAFAEALSGYRPLGLRECFALEDDDFVQGYLDSSTSALPLQGEVALVTGAASGIGRACASELLRRGAAVLGLDVDAEVSGVFEGSDWLGMTTDITDPAEVRRAVGDAVDRFGSIDIAVLAAGVFGPSHPLDGYDAESWRAVMAVNLDATADVLGLLHPLLSVAPRYGRVVFVGSKNVAAPGPGVAAYSASKAGATQLARVAALEWASDGIRVNTVHPDSVFDTGLWTKDVLESRAKAYGLSVDDYKRRNLLSTEVKSADVARLVVDLVGPGYQAITGAQIPIDGGNVRVV